MKTAKLIRWPRLVIGGIALMCAGIVYAWSILKAPFESVWNSEQLGLNYTLTVCFFCVGGLISGLISKKTTALLRLILSGVLLFLGFFITSRLIGSQLDSGSAFLLFLSYGVLAGMGIGFAYNTVIGVTSAWYPDKTGLCTGTLLMCFGLGSLILGRLSAVLGSPDSIGWKNTYIVLAIVIGVILVAAAFLVKRPPAGTEFPKAKAIKKSGRSEPIKDYSAPEMLKRLSFYQIFVMVTLVASSGSAVNSFAKDIMKDVNAVESVAITMAVVLPLFNGFGRIASGWLYDGIGLRKTTCIIGALAVTGPVVVVLALAMNSLALCVVGLCLCLMSYGTGSTVLTVYGASFYGPMSYSLNISILMLVLIPAPFAATIAGRIKDATGGFSNAFIILIVCSALAFLISLTIKKP